MATAGHPRRSLLAGLVLASDVHICESTSPGGPIWYRGRSRENGDRIDLPAQYGDIGIYTDNGEFQYYVNSDVLSVYKGDEQIFEEPVLSVR